MRLIACFILSAFTYSIYAQVDRTIDSLELFLEQHREIDTMTLHAMRSLSFNYCNKDTRKSIRIAYRVIELAKQLNNEKEIGDAYGALGIAYGFSGNLDSSIWAFEQEVERVKQQSPIAAHVTTYQNLGISYGLDGNHKAALNSFYKGLEICEKLNLGKEGLYGSIANTYTLLKDYKMALHYDTLTIREADNRNAPDHFKDLAQGNYAVDLLHLGFLKEAKQILQKCIAYRIRTNDKFYLAGHYSALATINIEEQKYDEAYANYYESIKLNREIGNWAEVSKLSVGLALAEFSRQNISSAKKFALNSFLSSDSLKLLHTRYEASKLLSKIALVERDYKLSKYYDGITGLLEDSINIEEQSKAVAEINARYETDKKEKENELLKLTQLRHEAEIAVQRYAIIMIATTLVAVLVLLFVVYRSQQLFKKTNALLKKKNEAIEAQQKEIILQKEKIADQMEKLRKAQAQLVQSEKMASLGQMTSGIAHEINNPLNFISGGVAGLKFSVRQLIKLARLQKETDTAEVDELANEVTELLGSIGNGVHRANRIITSLRTFSSPTGALSPVNIIDTIEMAITMLGSKISNNNIKVIRDYSESVMPIVANASELSQVFTNIIDNAIQAMEGVSGPRELFIKTQLLNGQTSVVVQDTGQGIPAHIQEKIMEPFFTTKEVGKGTGLGLAISYSIIEKHKGKLIFTSEEGRGTAFTITFDT